MAFRTNKMPVLQEKSASGVVATFNTALAMLLASCNIAVNAWQEGSGTPSPDNVRPINGWSAINIGNISDNTNINFFQGLLNGTYGFIDLGNKTWYYSHDANAFYVQDLPIILTGYTNGTKAPMICYEYETVPYYANGAYFEGKDKVTAFAVQAGRRLYVKDTSYGTDTVAFKTAMSGVYLIFKLQTPTTPTITDTQFDTLLTAFGLSGSMFTIQIGSTVYGGEYDARTGVLTVTHGYIASYNGEVINEPWISSMDKYVEGGTPTSGAQVVYPLSTPTTIQLPPCPIDTLEGVNNIWADTGDVDLTYKDLDIAKRGNFREVFKLPS